MEGPEDEVVARAQAGDVEAFAELVRAHHVRVYRLALRLTGNPADAEEIVQDTFMRAHERIAEFRGEARFVTWLCRIATNTALMRLRSASRRPVEPLDAYLPALDEQGLHARQDLALWFPEDPEAFTERGEIAATCSKAWRGCPIVIGSRSCCAMSKGCRRRRSRRCYTSIGLGAAARASSSAHATRMVVATTAR